MDLFKFIPGYETTIYLRGREPAFVMMLAFIVTFVITRGYTRIARVRGWGSASFGGVHTHHMVFGLVIAFVSSALMFGFNPDPGLFLLALAMFFGIGASLVLDEFALIFHLQDVYWENEGRKSVDAVVLGMAFGSIFLLQVTPFGTTADESGWLIVGAVAINLPLVLISAFKGKIFLAIFGVFIPTLSLVGAIRLAEPDSLWARRLYGSEGKKMAKSKTRYDGYNKKWRSRKERAWDLIGGKPGRPTKPNTV